MPFDPDQYLAMKESGAGSSDFDPDAYLASKEAPSSFLESGARGLAAGITFNQAPKLTGLAEAVKDKILGSQTPFMDLASQHAAESKANYQAAQKAHPYVYGGAKLAGSVVPALATDGSTLALAGLGAAQAVGDTDSTDPVELAKRGLMGAGLGVAGGKLVEAATPALSDVGNYIANKLGTGAEDLAVNATGATGRQALQFPENTGRELLDRGLVRLGNNQGDIAENIGNAISSDPSLEGVLGPVQEAAAMKASNLKQAMPFGLGDMLSSGPAVAAAMGGNPAYAAKLALLPIARRVVAPRAASTGAVAMDALSNIVRTSPQLLEQYAPALTSSAAKGEGALAVTNYILGTSDPGYRRVLGRVLDTDSNEK